MDKEVLVAWLGRGKLEEELTQFINESTCVFADILDEETGDTLFHWLCHNTTLEFIANLLEIYPELVNVQNKFNETPLIHATIQGKQALVYLLISYYADPSLQNIDGKCAQVLANEVGHNIFFIPRNFKRIFELKEKYPFGSPQEQIQLLSEIISEFSLLMPIDQYDNTFFHFLIANSHLRALHYILHNTSPKLLNCQNCLGETPLLVAVVNGRRTLVQVLMNFNPDLTIKDIYGKTVEVLRKKATSAITLKPLDLHAILPIISSLEKDTSEVTYFEVINELKNNIQALAVPLDLFGNNILHLAVFNGSLKIIIYLLTIMGSAINYKNDLGQTALDIAEKNNTRLLAKILSSYGAKSAKSNPCCFFNSNGCRQFNER